ncbi:MAG TPA: MarC family protein [Vicinamibacterales bacterium]|nr:MarC family protein [Vicinamibacterales bacterium]
MTDDLAAIVRAATLAVAALMPIVNPLGSAPIFLSMSADLPTAARRHLSRQVAWNSFLLLAAAMLVGSHVLRLFGISVPIVRVGGGLLVIANGWRLLNADDVPAASKPPVIETWEREVARRAFYPLTFPLTVGPGSISIAITLGAGVSSRSTTGVVDLVSVLVGVALVALSVYLSYRFASRLISLLGDTGAAVFLRLSSFILLCVGVAIMWGGIVDLVQPLLSRR